MKVAFLVVDNREAFRDYEKDQPFFGTAPEGLLHGFKSFPKEVEIHVIGCTQRVMKSPAKLAENIYFHSLVVPKIGWLKTGYQGCIRAVRSKLKEIDPDVIHAQGTERECGISGAWSSKPKVLTIHGNLRQIDKLMKFPLFSAMWLQSKFEGWTIRQYDGVVCITKYTEESVRQEARKMWVLPNAVEEAYFGINALPSDREKILCVGNVDPRKNQIFLMRALQQLASRQSFELVFFGGVSHAEYGSAFHEELARSPWCRYGGKIGRRELAAELGRATGLILPSLEDNCPMVLLEAMAAGVPVLASAVGGIPELIQNKINGFLFSSTDAAAMASAVEELLTHPEEARLMAERARDTARTTYHPQVIAREHIRIYAELVARRGA